MQKEIVKTLVNQLGPWISAHFDRREAALLDNLYKVLTDKLTRNELSAIYNSRKSKKAKFRKSQVSRYRTNSK